MFQDSGGGWHRVNGQWASAAEIAAYLAGKSAGFAAGVVVGTTRGIAIGVAMSAKVIGWPLQLLWDAIRGGRSRSA